MRLPFRQHDGGDQPVGWAWSPSGGQRKIGVGTVSGKIDSALIVLPASRFADTFAGRVLIGSAGTVGRRCPTSGYGEPHRHLARSSRVPPSLDTASSLLLTPVNTEMRPSDNSTGLIHRRFPANFIETSSQGGGPCAAPGAIPGRTTTGAKPARPPPRRAPNYARATHPRVRPLYESPALAPCLLALDGTAIPVAGQHNSCHKHTGRQCASGESRRGAREAEQHPPRLGARAGGRLAKIVDGSRGIGSRTTPRQWVEAMGGRHRQRDRFITGATTVVQR